MGFKCWITWGPEVEIQNQPQQIFLVMFIVRTRVCLYANFKFCFLNTPLRSLVGQSSLTNLVIEPHILTSPTTFVTYLWVGVGFFNFPPFDYVHLACRRMIYNWFEHFKGNVRVLGWNYVYQTTLFPKLIHVVCPFLWIRTSIFDFFKVDLELFRSY